MRYKILKVFFVFFMLFMLVGCNNNNTGTYNIVLRNEDDSVYLETEVNALTSYTFPDLEEDGKVFLGWSDGSYLYYGEISVVVNYDLTAVFEVANEVFTYDREGDDGLRLTSYTGDARILKIPEVIDGYYTRIIDMSTFKDSNIEGVYIPNTVKTINTYAFRDADELEFVSFYGEYMGYEDRLISNEEYDDLIDEFSDACTVNWTDSSDSSHYTYNDGCPIKEVYGTTAEIVIGGVTYFSYEVSVDLAVAIDFSAQRIASNAFYSAGNLTKIDLPDRIKLTSGEVFAECYNIEQVNLSDDALYYKSVDGVWFSKNMDSLIYYPSGLTETEYIIPDTVLFSSSYAFSNNDYLETIVIGENLSEFGFVYNMSSLTNYIVNPDNENLFSDEGVLYLEEGMLVSYPSAKLDLSYTVVSGTISILDYSFSHNKFLEELDLGESIDKIQSRAFYKSLSLTTLEIPDSISTIYLDFVLRSNVETVIIYYTGSDNTPTLMQANLDPRNIDEYDAGVELPERLLPDIYIPDETFSNYFFDSPNNYWLRVYVTQSTHKISELETK